MSRKLNCMYLVAGLLGAMAGTARAEDVEVLHYWTSGGESKAVGVLRDMVQAQHYTWKDSAVAGGGGANAMTVLKTRVVSGTPPQAVQMRGPAIQDWADQGVLAPIDSIAGQWSRELPAVIDATLKFDGKYYAVPHWIHRVNWMYLNKALLDKVGGTPPTNWDEFFALCDKLKKAGYTAIAHGDTPYEDANFFEGVVLSFGAEFFKKALLQQDQAALTSPQMVQVFDILRRFQPYYDEGIQGRPWNLSTAMLIDGKAGIFFMGDWATGEFTAANKKPDQDYICAPRPGTQGLFTFNADTFVFFRQKGGEATAAQLNLAKDIMSPAYQGKAAMFKGAIPANLTVPTTEFNACSQKSEAALQEAIKANTLLPSFNQGVNEAKLGAMRDVVVKFMNSTQDSKSAAQDLARAAKTN